MCSRRSCCGGLERLDAVRSQRSPHRHPIEQLGCGERIFDPLPDAEVFTWLEQSHGGAAYRIDRR